MLAAIETELAARTSDAAHDASRAFHFAVAAATGNQAFVRLLEALWIADVGRRLLAQRARAPTGRTTTSRSTEAIVDGDRGRATASAPPS